MNNEEFENIFDGMLSTSRSLLVEKAKEYASDKDRLHNFKAAAGALNVTPELALRGMSTKHTISVNDMVKDPSAYSMAQWEEKIGDEFNYLILLKALVWERLNEEADVSEPLAQWEIDLLNSSNDEVPIPHFDTWKQARQAFPDQNLRHLYRDETTADLVIHGNRYKFESSAEPATDGASTPVELPYYPSYGHMHEAHPGVGDDFTWVKIDDLHKSKQTLNPETDINVHGLLYRKVNL